jgi:hypothetical protein
LAQEEIDGWLLSLADEDLFPKDSRALPDSDEGGAAAYSELLDQILSDIRERFKDTIGPENFVTALDQLDDTGILWDEYVLPLDEEKLPKTGLAFAPYKSGAVAQSIIQEKITELLQSGRIEC